MWMEPTALWVSDKAYVPLPLVCLFCSVPFMIVSVISIASIRVREMLLLDFTTKRKSFEIKHGYRFF